MPSRSSQSKKGGGTDPVSTTTICDLCSDTLEKGQSMRAAVDAMFIATVLEYISKNLSRAAFPLSVLCPDRLHAKTLQQLQDEVPTLMFELAKTEGLCE